MKNPATKIAFLCITLCISSFAKSQVTFNHSLGGSLYIASSFASGYGILYSPRLNFIDLSDEATVSIGTHLCVGLSGSSNSQTGTTGSFCLDAPIMAELNFGHAANPDASSNFGGFVGFGFGFNHMSYSDATFGVGSFSAAGLVFNGGIRALIKEKSVGARVSYMLNTKTGGANVIGIGVFYTLGMD